MKADELTGGGRNEDLADGGCFPEELQPLHRCEGYDIADPKPIEFGDMPFGEKTVTEERVDGKSNARKSGCATVDLLTIHLPLSLHLYYFCVFSSRWVSK